MDTKLLQIAETFLLKGKISDIGLFGNGHINKTYLVTTDENKYILQKVNTVVFKEVSILINNINVITTHLNAKHKETLTFIRTKDGKFTSNYGDEVYRMYLYIPNSLSYEGISSLKMISKDAHAFACFHNYLSDLDASLLGETIPFFHDTPKRYEAFLEAVKNAKPERLARAKEDIENIKKYANELDKIVNGIASGEIRYTVTHNDPKINNVLFDKYTDEFRAVIDLDTVMPGSILYDIGDSLRSLFTGENEDNKDPTTCHVFFDYYEAYVSAYLAANKENMSELEVKLIPYSAFLLAIELGIRFLGDYLNNDIYFGVQYEEHNLVRARTQIHLANDIYSKLDDLEEISKKYL